MSKPLTFVISSASRNIDDFQTLAQQAARLQQRGRVEMGISTLGGPTRNEIPPGGSPWHAYTNWLASLEKFFPHPDLLPFIDTQHVQRNQQLLREKVAILRNLGMGAAVAFHMPWYLPADFFARYPHLRGPRVDHPRRTRQEAFAICVDLPEGRGFYAQMFGELTREVSELSSVFLSTNDAGGGLCWADWLYNGPNGPAHCRNRDVGERVRGLIDALRAAAPGRTIEFTFRGNFSDVELRAMAHYHDEHFRGRSQGGQEPRQIYVGSELDNPVLGVFNPVAILKTLDRLREPAVDRVMVNFSANYSRGHELFEVSEKVLELIDTYCTEPAFGRRGRDEFLWSMCARWVGNQQADTLFEAFHDLHDAYAYRAATVPRFTANYVGVSMRHINRPLVAVPERLTPEEESYWLPHVFNRSVHEARVDYIDWHGGRLSGPTDVDQGSHPRIEPIIRFVAMMNRIADQLQSLQGETAEIFRRMGTSLRIYASIIRSTGNFYGVQKLRDRNRDKLTGEPRTPSKDATWTGDPDLQMFNEFMRDELDNTTALIRLLENGGMSQVLTAREPAEEDTFLLGPDLIAQLKRKCSIMCHHCRDIEQYLSTPHK